MLSETGKHRMILTLLLLILSSAGLFAQAISLTAELEQREIWLGDSLQLTLYLKGSEEAIKPELFIPGLSVEPLGGTVRSSRSITNINGKVTEKVSEAYVYAYNLTPRHPGRFTVPPITVTIEGQHLSTEALMLNVLEPETSDDFSLELYFEEDDTYIDEECRLRVSFFYSTSLRSLSIMIPGLESIPGGSLQPTEKTESYEITVNGKPVIFGRDDRADVAGLTAYFSVRPEQSGMIRLEDSTASFESAAGVQRVRDFFGRIQEQEVFDRQVIPAEDVSLHVLPFPREEQPEDFFGLSGDIRLEVTAEPVQVHLGDPITLKLYISGMNNTGVEIPDLSALLGNGFDIPDTRSSGKVEGRNKTITQTVRIDNTAVQKIPEITFSYFDPESGTYKTSSSNAVPVDILETQVLTEADLEGGSEDGDSVGKILIGKKRDGIYYNYAGGKLLESQNIMMEELISSPLIKILLLIPPFIFISFWVYTVLLPKGRLSSLARLDRSKALRTLKRRISKADISVSDQNLKDFNRNLIEFLKHFGLDDDQAVIQTEREIINRAIYGGAEIPGVDLLSAMRRIVELLDKKEPQNV